MDEHIRIIISIIVICLILFLTTLPQSHCQLLPPPPPFNHTICKEQSYSCGDLSNNISYPFWDGNNRHRHCGGGDLFHLHCQGGHDTTILIGPQNFTVLEIHPETHIMRMKQTELAHDVCSPPKFNFNDTYLSPTLFRYPTSVYNITIFYDCPSDVIRTYGHPFCDNKATFQPGTKDEALEAYPDFRRCGRHVQVPYSTLPPGGVELDLERAIGDGFEVRYNVDEDCVRCLGGARSDHGDCWNNTNDTVIEQHVQRSCYYSYCPDGSASTTQCSAHHKSGWNWKRKLVIGVMSAVSATILLMCFIFCCFRCKPSKRVVKTWLTAKNDQDIEVFLKNHGALSQKRYKFSEVKKMTNSFKIKLGQGGFGAVYKGKLSNGCHVAVKILNASKGNGEEFINEVASISRTSHVNVVTLVGFCFEGRKKALIYEFMPNGSLDKFINNKGPETIASLSWENLYKIAKEIARGLEYLHRGCNTRILHFDIKPHNVLLDENFCPKISDFGLAKLCPRKESIISMSDPRGTIGYIAPEVWNRQFGGVSHKSDVYSYGMMLLEMVGARKNINAEGSHTSEYFPDWVYNKIELGKDLKPDEVMATEENEIIRRMTIVGLWCIQTFPSDRPTMSRVIDMLEGSMDSLEIPPKPKLSSPTRSLPESSTS